MLQLNILTAYILLFLLYILQIAMISVQDTLSFHYLICIIFIFYKMKRVKTFLWKFIKIKADIYKRHEC